MSIEEAPGSIELTVFDAYSNRKMSSPNVVIKSYDGVKHKNLEDLPPGSYTLTVTKSGYYNN